MKNRKIAGTIQKVKHFAGSFHKVTLNNGKTYTLGLGPEDDFPQRGQSVVISGIVNGEGRFLTCSWEQAE